MSKIFPSGSGVQFESVTFLDLESRDAGKDSFFVPKFQPKHRQKEERAAEKPEASATKQTKSAPEQKIDLEAIKKEAYTRGKSDGRQEAEGKLHTASQALADGLEQISRLRESLLTKSKEDMVRLIIGVARQVIQTEVEEKKEIVVKTVTRALEAAVQSDEYTITVHPEDLKVVTEQEPLLLAGMRGLQNISFRTDEAVSRGGCLAESHTGDVDAAIETQLNEMHEHLRKEILTDSRTFEE
ncbi:MAG: flagellar assembly protein FliH [Desulfohalobiaceae bacterium]|nr:flagellar assembly protein FliH [Desulfohalobiaceae bacterium]